MTSKINVVVCGAAFGRFYLRALVIHPDIELIGILSRGAEASARCACEMGIAHYHASDAYIASIRNPTLVPRQSAWVLSVTRSWHQFSTLLGPPALIEPDTPPEVGLCQQLCQQEVE